MDAILSYLYGVSTVMLINKYTGGVRGFVSVVV